MSKELEAWKRVRESAENADGDAAVYEIGDCDIVEKELKALEIIKNKGVFVHFLRQSENVEVYNSCMIVAFKEMAKKDYEGVVKKFCLTQEEFDLLKEVLSNEA